MAPDPDWNPFDDPRALNRPWFESPFFERLLASGGFGDERAEQVRRFREDGYLVAPGLIEPELVDRILARYDWLFDPRTEFDAPPHILHALALDRNRRQDAWGVCPPVRELACHERVLELLRFLYAREPIPFQTLNFLRGSTQSMHSDSFHFSSVPAGFMCGVWVALEDVTSRNGPLMYVRGSHRYPDVQLNDLRLWMDRQGRAEGPSYQAYERYVHTLLEARRPEVERLECPKGTVLIWCSNLLHGGAPIEDPASTRKSQVTHYYFDDCVYYTPVHSNAALGEFDLRAIRDIRTDAPVPHKLNGKELQAIDLGYPSWELYRLRRHDDDLADGAPDPVAKLQERLAEIEAERGRLARDVAGFQAERDNVLAHAADLERRMGRMRDEFLAEREKNLAHSADLEVQLEHVRSRPSYRALGWLKSLLGGGRR